MENKILTTNIAMPPKMPLGQKQFWKCIFIRPQTGLPCDANGHLILTYVWQATAKIDPKAAPADPPKKTHRGIMADQADLFAK